MRMIYFLDIPECSNTEEPPCHEYADCTELAPGYTCECRDGFYGNGLYCEGNEKAFQKFFMIVCIFLLILMLQFKDFDMKSTLSPTKCLFSKNPNRL